MSQVTGKGRGKLTLVPPPPPGPSVFARAKDLFNKYYFLASALILLGLYILLEKKGRTIEQLKMDAQKLLLNQKMAELNEKAVRSSAEYVEANKEYENIKRTHGALLDRLGISHANPGGDGPQPPKIS